MTPSCSSESSINMEMKTKVVDWNDYSQLTDSTSHKITSQGGLKEEDRRCDIKEEISDSIFTNVFFSTATKTTSSLSHQRPVTITYSRPRKNILTVSDKLFGKADKHKPKVQEPVMGDEDDLSDGARTGEICSEMMTDESVQCNGIGSEDKKMTDEANKNIRNCFQENGGIEKVCSGSLFLKRYKRPMMISHQILLREMGQHDTR